MLKIIVPKQELFNNRTNEFLEPIEETELILEHSLVSVQEWESKWHIPFLTNNKTSDKTEEQIFDYIRCMTLNREDVDSRVYHYLPANAQLKIIEYIKDPMTATWFSNNDLIGAQKHRGEVVTAEIIYWWMVGLDIPQEYRFWHLGQLLTLIKVISEKNQPEKKMSQKDWAKQRDALNEARKAKYHTNG